jgi:hypothetical protein
LPDSHAPPALREPISPTPEHRFANLRPRRCQDPDCGAVGYRGPKDRHHPLGRFLCAGCQRDVPRNGLRPCPMCGGRANVDQDRNELWCFGGCEPIELPWKDAPAAWEHAVREDLETGRNRYDRYSGPSEIERRFGHEDHRGKHLQGADDFAIETAHQLAIERIDEMTKALDAYGQAVQRDPSVLKAGPSWFRDFGGPACLVLVNAILARGGAYKGAVDFANIRPARTTPFAGYRHAVSYCWGDPEYQRVADHRDSLSSPMGRLSSNFYTTSLPQGMQFDTVVAKPSRNGAALPRPDRYQGEDDVGTCIRAARIGGEWQPVQYRADGTVDTPARCKGGRPLTATELELLRLCDVGQAMPCPGDRNETEFRRLKVGEALACMRRCRADYPDARHMLEADAKALLKAARLAVREALLAWQAIPLEEPRKPRQGAAAPDDGPPRVRAAFAPTLGPAFASVGA